MVWGTWITWCNSCPTVFEWRQEWFNVIIHTFSDASEKAYTVVTYARQQYEERTVSTHLVAAKSRLAPLKAMSIPRLELMATLTGLRLTLQISRALGIPMSKATFWVDSANVGFWVQGQSRNYKTVCIPSGGRSWRRFKSRSVEVLSN